MPTGINGLTHKELVFEYCKMKSNLDYNYTSAIDVIPNGISFDTESINQLKISKWNQSEKFNFILNLIQSNKIQKTLEVWRSIWYDTKSIGKVQFHSKFDTI